MEYRGIPFSETHFTDLGYLAIENLCLNYACRFGNCQ